MCYRVLWWPELGCEEQQWGPGGHEGLEAPEVREAPEGPEWREALEVPERLEAPEVPESHEEPEAPESHEEPEVPESHEEPEAPEAPEHCEAPEGPVALEASGAVEPVPSTLKEGAAPLSEWELERVPRGVMASERLELGGGTARIAPYPSFPRRGRCHTGSAWHGAW